MQRIFKVTDDNSFNDLALEIFQRQYRFNRVYRTYADHLGIDAGSVRSIEDIPFLPVEFFKSAEVICEGYHPELTFLSSGTTGSIPSRHHVADAWLYKESLTRCFRMFFGDPKQYCIMALLPSFSNRSNSSLVFMVNELIRQSAHELSGFYLDKQGMLAELIEKSALERKVMLFGVTFSLLDLVERKQWHAPGLIVIETGGMKGRRAELIREDLHGLLCAGFGLNHICSEYSMTEILSQAYAKQGGRFMSPPWMRVLVRDLHDPFAYLPAGRTGPLNIIDLANVHSCSFIATQDLGKINPDDTFEVLGRTDQSDLRGCSLLV